MRIAFAPAARLLSDHRPNGEALIAVETMRRLAARGHDVVAYCETADLHAPLAGVDVREVSAAGRTAALSRINFARRIAADAARERFDVLHSLFPMNTDSGYTLASGAPLVCGPLNLPWPDNVRAARRVLARAAALVFDRVEGRLHRRTFERAARLLVTGATSRAAIPPHLHDRCIEVPFGVDPERFCALPLPDDNTILFLSVLQARKGIDVLVRAMPAVVERVPRARLIVAGADPDGMRPGLEALAASLGVAQAIEWAGPVAPEAAVEMHRRARIFCQPSLAEPFGMTTLEAMACARPVVGTAAGGTTDLIVDRRGGRLIPPGDAGFLSEALIEVLCHPEEAAAMAAFNRARAERRFSIERVIDRIELTYEALAAVRREGAVVAA